MYHNYFGLKEEPFSIAVNPRYLFMSARHRDALAHLLYGVGIGGGFILLTGEVGTGKTTINRCLLEQLPDNTDIALILNPALNAVELLATVCDELNIDYQSGEQSLKILTDKLHQFLLTNHASGRNTVLLIDEAQHLQFEVLEQIRLLTNLETNTKKLLQIILVGQPELRSLLNRPELRQLAQRITARYQLKPLNIEETQAYIRHRLHIAGLPANQELFPKPIVKNIHKASRGVPRIINVLCDRMLLGTYGQNKTIVDRAMLKQAIVEVMGEEDDIELSQPRNMAPVFTILGLVLIALIVLWKWPLIESYLQPMPDVSISEAPIAAPNPEKPPTAITQPEKIEPVVEQPIIVESPWVKSSDLALQEITLALDIPVIDCQQLSVTYRCEQFNVVSWQDLMVYNRAAVLTLITPTKIKQYAAMLSLNENEAVILKGGRSYQVDLEEFGQMWTGDFTLIWQPPIHYRGPIKVGDTGPMIKWLASQFATLDGQKTKLAAETFTTRLEQRVKIFQNNHQLKADGVVGLKTLLVLDGKLAAAESLTTTPQKAEGI